jgi:SET domain-containing protein
MSKKTGLPRIARAVRRSRRRVFALEPIARNTRITDYAGELVRNGPESRAREERDLEAGCVWVFRINRAWSRDAAVGLATSRGLSITRARQTAGSRSPARRSGSRAVRAIRSGEELTYDYAIIGARTVPCRCRPGCPNRI